MNTDIRAADLFTRAANLALEDCNRIHADHSAKGLLGSGNTIIRATEAFKSRTSQALNQVLSEVSARIDHRGRRWHHEIAKVGVALNEHLARADDVLAASKRLARAPDRASDMLLEKVRHDLDAQFNEFRDGWTSPRSKPWIERHPVIYAVIMLLIGAVAGQLPAIVHHLL